MTHVPLLDRLHFFLSALVKTHLSHDVCLIDNNSSECIVELVRKDAGEREVALKLKLRKSTGAGIRKLVDLIS